MILGIILALFSRKSRFHQLIRESTKLKANRAITTPSNFSRLEGLWAGASARFARNAQQATVFQGTRNRGAQSVWGGIEQPILDNRGIQYIMKIFD